MSYLELLPLSSESLELQKRLYSLTLPKQTTAELPFITINYVQDMQATANNVYNTKQVQMNKLVQQWILNR